MRFQVADNAVKVKWFTMSTALTLSRDYRDCYAPRVENWYHTCLGTVHFLEYKWDRSIQAIEQHAKSSKTFIHNGCKEINGMQEVLGSE